MKTIVTLKSFPDHEGIPGHQGGSLPRNTARPVFEGLLDDMKTRVEANRRAYYAKIVEDAQPWVGKTYRDLWNEYHKKFGQSMDYRQKLMADLLIPNSAGMTTVLRISDKAATTINKWVKQDIDSMFNSFIEKQVGKVDDIFKGRAITKAMATINTSLEATFKFELADGAKFDMTTQIVWKTSSTGKSFWQFPSTFHNAYKADGTKISPASEANLKANL